MDFTHTWKSSSFHFAGLTLPLFIELGKWRVKCVCVLGISILIFDCGIVPIVYFAFHFITKVYEN